VDFDIAHRFVAAPEDVARALLDKAYQESLDGIGPLSERVLLGQEEHRDGSVTRRVRCVLGIDLGAAKRFLGDSEPAWVEEATWDPVALRWEWVIVPEVAENLLSADGRIELTNSAAGTERRVTGRVKINVPLYGGRVEGWIVDGLKDAYDEEADRLEKWLATND
jgi:hypothetical protein